MAAFDGPILCFVLYVFDLSLHDEFIWMIGIRAILANTSEREGEKEQERNKVIGNSPPQHPAASQVLLLQWCGTGSRSVTIFQR